jgi:D-alanyl-D-alanine carboxypeptidase (penicillin-binding protein 5/6)
MMHMLSKIKISIALLILCLNSGIASAFETNAKAAYVYDLTTGTVLLSKNADTPLPPASMSKLMTLYLAFEFIRAGQLNLDEKLPVSTHAQSYGGSTMFLDTTDRVTVADLLRGIIVLSGNDACAVIAEALSPDGTEAGFAKLMTSRAQQLGMTNSTFQNSNGWPHPMHRMSMRDLGLLATRLITDFPEYYDMFAESEFKFDGRAPANTRNRNPLLGLNVGADGLKTGHTQEAGYGLVGSAQQGDRRIIFVLSGLSSTNQRADEAEAIVNWAFRQFSTRTYGKAGDVVTRATVWDGSIADVGLALSQDLTTLVPILGNADVKFEIEYLNPIPAPINKGEHLGHLVVTVPELERTQIALIAADNVPRGGFFRRILTAGQSLLSQMNSKPESGS